MQYEDLCRNIGLKINFFRQTAQLTQAQLAENLNMDVRYLSDIECGKKNITLKTLYKITTVLKIDPAELFIYKHSR